MPNPYSLTHPMIDDRYTDQPATSHNKYFATLSHPASGITVQNTDS